MDYTQDNLKYSFYEVSEILKYIPEKYNKKLPEKIKNLINQNKISNGFIYDKNKTLDNQEILHDTKILLSILYREYWCTNEKRRELEEIDYKILKEKYNNDNIFKKYNQNVENETKENKMLIVQYKKSILKRIINKIKNILRK